MLSQLSVPQCLTFFLARHTLKWFANHTWYDISNFLTIIIILFKELSHEHDCRVIACTAVSNAGLSEVGNTQPANLEHAIVNANTSQTWIHCLLFLIFLCPCIKFTSALPMGFPPWLSRMQNYYYLSACLSDVTMDTRVTSFRFREVFFVILPDLPAKFGAHRSINHGVVSAQTNIVTLLKL